jgi:DoxX-like family
MRETLWAGRIVSAVAVLFLVLDGVTHLMKPAPVAEAFHRLAFPLSLSVELGVIELACVAVYVIPRTSILGAILLTGYLGGAVATHLRVFDPFFDTIFPILIGALVWGGIYLRDPRLRALVHFKSTSNKF